MNKKRKILIIGWIVFFIIVIFLFSSCSQTAFPFAGTTKHHPIKRMTTHQVRQAQHGNYLYTNHSGVVKRNTMKSSQYIKRRK
jgi:hypothetical protein